MCLREMRARRHTKICRQTVQQERKMVLWRWGEGGRWIFEKQWWVGELRNRGDVVYNRTVFLRVNRSTLIKTPIQLFKNWRHKYAENWLSLMDTKYFVQYIYTALYFVQYILFLKNASKMDTKYLCTISKSRHLLQFWYGFFSLFVYVHGKLICENLAAQRRIYLFYF